MTATARSHAPPTTPYKGLTSYTEGDADFFFGRERECDAIIACLKARRLTLLYGESGVGKSSMLRAGVAARLRDSARETFMAMEAAEFIPMVFSAWRDQPLAGLTTLIEDSVGEFVSGSAGALASRPLERVIRAAAERSDAYLLVILDQFEDYFLYGIDDAGEGTFACEFPRVLNQAGLPASFLISIREDALASLDRFKREIPKLFDSTLRVGHLDPASARQAIVRPVERYNQLVGADHRFEIEPALVDAVIEQRVATNQALRERIGERVVNGHTRSTRRQSEIEAPYLQLVLTRLWEAEQSSGSQTMRLATLTSLGGAGEIVRTHLDSALADLQPDERETAADIFDYLVTPSGAKVAHSAPDLAKYSGHSSAEVLSLLDKLAAENARIVRPVPSPPGEEGPPRFEIYHDLLAAAIRDWRNRQEMARETARLERAKQRAELEARAERARARKFLVVAVGSGALLVVAIALFIYALRQRADAINAKHAATRKATEATYLGLTAAAQSQLDSRPDVAMLLFLEAHRALPQRLVENSLVATLEAVQRSGTLGILHGHTDSIESVAFSPDGRIVASGSADSTIRLWSAATHRTLGQPLIGPRAPVFSVAFSHSGRILASGSFDEMRLWNVQDHAELGAPIVSSLGVITSVAFGPDDRVLASGSLSGTVALWNVADHAKLRTLDSHIGPVRKVAVSHKGNILAAIGTGGIQLWSLRTFSPLGHALASDQGLYSLAFSPDDQLLASGSGNHTITLWSVGARSRVGRPLVGHTGIVNSLAFANNQTLASGSADGTVRLWSVATHMPLGPPLVGHAGGVTSIAFSRDGQILASGSADRTIRLWSTAADKKLAVPVPSPRSVVWSVAFSPDGSTLAVARDDKTIFLFDFRSGVLVDKLRTGSAVKSIAFSPDGRLLASAGGSGRILLWDTETGHLRGQALIGRDGAPVFSVAFSPDRRTLTLASGEGNGYVRLWNVNTRREIGQPLRGHIAAVFSVAFSPDGRELASGSDDRTIRLWHIPTGRLLGQPMIHAAGVYTVAFSPDGHTLASGGADDTVRLWNVRTQKPLGGPLTGHLSFVRSVAFSPSGQTLASASSDRTMRLWNVATHSPLGGPLTGHTGSVEHVAFSPNGRILVSGSADGSVRIWTDISSVPFAKLQADVCRFVGSGLSRVEWRQYAPSVHYQETCH